ncbi:phosphonate ABC transporter, permease protein PhnE [Calidithermus roseus]|uniref:Phosphate-import permease protein PhnE n=1 Tax=Calidithermus roseus TaxID=1644118 RepID=A0A399EN50_9DEIN|nr:phosphonate ABC transporter, permease protein PhnE [Calidithermus roseus]RIH86047.1 Phosphate-import permease protein PhnE [Calidithermus roseus]
MSAALVYALLGLGLAVLLSVARGSMRRLIYGGVFGIAIAFVAFPFVQSLGYLTRETVSPTLLGLLPRYPLLALVPVALVAAGALARRGGQMAALGGIVAGALTLFTGLFLIGQPAGLVRLIPLDGLMELLVALIPPLLLALLGRRRAKLRWPLIGAGVLLGGLVFFWLNSSGGGHLYLPKMAGYYRLLGGVEPGLERRIVEEYNAGLEERNAILREIGQPEEKPVQSLGDFKGRIPQETAAQGYRLLQPSQLQYGAFAVFILAGLMLGAGLVQLRRPQLQEPGDLRSGLILAALVGVLLPAFDATEFALQKLVKGWPFLVSFMDKAWPPNLTQINPSDPERSIFPLQSVLSEMALTIEIALVGTFLAAIFAVPTSFLAARNLTQGSPLMRGLFAFMRTFYNVDRGVDTLILALVFVAAVGLGPFAGVLAMAIHSIADLGKLYSEAIENVERGPIEALESTGTAGVNVLRWAILPQVLPLFVSYTLYRFEINFRVSVVLGLVGAGGIGYFIKGAMDGGNYDQMIIGVIAIVIVVNLIDFASSWLRSRLV